NSYDIDIPILGGLDLSCVEKGHSLLFGIMSSDIKRKLVNKAKALNVNIDFFLHETVLVGKRTSIGIGLVAFPNVIISCDVTLGDLIFINCGSQIGHDVKIGDYTSIMANVDIGGGAQI